MLVLVLLVWAARLYGSKRMKQLQCKGGASCTCTGEGCESSSWEVCRVAWLLVVLVLVLVLVPVQEEGVVLVLVLVRLQLPRAHLLLVQAMGRGGTDRMHPHLWHLPLH
jgi:hypothetical protein